MLNGDEGVMNEARTPFLTAPKSSVSTAIKMILTNITIQLKIIAKIIDIFYISMVALTHNREKHQRDSKYHQIFIAK